MTVDGESNTQSSKSRDSSSTPLIFRVTENMLKANIKGFILNGSDFEFTFTDGRKRGITFSSKKGSISDITQKIKKKLSSELSGADLQLLNLVSGEIEDELINRRIEIFKLVNNGSNSNQSGHNPSHIRSLVKKYFEDVNTIRQQFNESSDPYKQWQSGVAEKYFKLRLITIKYYQEAWPMLEFCLSVKSILNIEGVTLPFMGVLLAAPASMKTVVIQLFRKYPNSFYSDSFTPNSLVSHNSVLSEEQLQQIDMLPKMKDKVFLTPELAPIFTSKEDELQKILGMITRILDGHGFESDSGAHGHRQYGDTMFVWIGAAVEIPYKIWKMLGTLGHKIYFFRPDLSEKTVEHLKHIANSNDFEAKFKQIEDALLEYLKVFDAAPDAKQVTRDKGGIVKVKWNESAAAEGQQYKAIEYIAQVSRLLAHLRGTVYISETKFTRRRYNYNSNDQYQQQSNLQQSQLQLLYSDVSHQIDGPDYDTDLPIIEDPSRAVILLRNLAIGHALSQGRDSIRIEDVPIAIKVALSTAMSNRIKIFDLLLKNNGELTTSGITKGLRISEPTARRTMREFHALRIADIFTITEYTNAELKITLRSEYDWFKTEEFKTLRDGFFPGYDSDDANVRTDGHNDYNGNAALSSQPHDGAELESGACDSQDRHTLKINLLPDADKKNNSRQLSNQQQDESAFNLEPENVDSDKGNTNDIKPTTTDDKCTLQEQRTQCIESTTTTNSESTLQERTQCDIKTDPPDIIEKNNVCACGSNDFQHVTQSHCHTLGVSVIRPVPADIETITLQEILSMIKAANGSQVASSTCIASLHSRNEQIRNYLGDNLTSRDNRKVRNLCLKIIRDDNIEVIKYKPQLVVKWVEVDSSSQSKPTDGDDNSTIRGDVP